MAMDKNDQPDGFPDDIFQTDGELKHVDNSSKNIHETDSQADTSAAHSANNNPFSRPIFSFSSRASSSSSGSGSSVDLFRVDHTEHTDIRTSKEEGSHHDASSSNASEPNATEPESSKFSNPRQTPPIQVMDRSENYDPSRIPASVFTPKSSSPMDWSVASNESLFSIQVGNNSFNREQFLLMGLDLRKSGELCKSGELYESGELYKPGGDMIYKSGELFSLSHSPPLTIAEMRESTDHESDFGTPKLGHRGAMDAKTRLEEDQQQPHSQPVSTRLSTISSHSDGSGISGASAGSFAFPILTDDKRDSTEKEASVNNPKKQGSKSSMKQSISDQLSTKIPSCSLCCCYCSCSCFSWRPRCKSCCC